MSSSLRGFKTIDTTFSSSRPVKVRFFSFFARQTNKSFCPVDGRHVMLPNGELHILSVRQGGENHQYNPRPADRTDFDQLLVRPHHFVAIGFDGQQQPDSAGDSHSASALYMNAGRVPSARLSRYPELFPRSATRRPTDGGDSPQHQPRPR